MMAEGVLEGVMLYNTMKRDKELFVAKEAGKATGKDGKTKV